jgi:uncharacterized membrane protein
MTAASLVSFLRSNWLLLIVLAALIAVVGVHLVWYIRPSDVKSMDDLNARLTRGQPTVIEFYSNL